MVNAELATTAKYIILEGIEKKNRFYTMNDPGDHTKLANGNVAYTIVGYANTTKEAYDIIGNAEYHFRTMWNYITELSNMMSRFDEREKKNSHE